MASPATNMAPSSRLVIPHFGIASVVWLLVLFLLLFNSEILHQHFFSFKLLAITHLFVLGFVTVVIFGALYQLIPVIFKTKLFSEKLAIYSLFSLLGGTMLVIIGFWFEILQTVLWVGGVLISISSLIFVLNTLLTIKNVIITKIEEKLILIAILWFFITCILGFLLAINLAFPFISVSHLELLKIHAHFGVVGWFLQLVFGVASVLIPMFLVSHNLNKKPLEFCFYLINSALFLGLFSSIFHFHIGTKIAFSIGALSLAFFLYFVYTVYKVRVKKKLDLGLKKTYLAFILLLLPLVFALVISNFDPNKFDFSISYLISILIGFISTIILGQTFKTLPFIIWLKEYKSVVGKEKTPLPKDLYSEKMLNLQLIFHLFGVLVLIPSLLFKINHLTLFAISLLIIAALIYNFNVFTIILHKRKKI